MAPRPRMVLFAAAGLLAALVWLAPAARAGGPAELVLGQGPSTEQALLGGMMAALLEAQGFKCRRETGLIKPELARQALQAGLIDLYLDSTGPAFRRLLKGRKPPVRAEGLWAVLSRAEKAGGLAWPVRLAADVGPALLMRREAAEKLGLRTVSDLADLLRARVEAGKRPFNLGLGAAALADPEGYPAFKDAYGLALNEKSLLVMDPGLVYQALGESRIEVGLGRAVDGRVSAFDLLALSDDKQVFPADNPAPVLRQETLAGRPELAQILSAPAAALTSAELSRLVYQVEVRHLDPDQVARDWLRSKGLLD